MPSLTFPPVVQQWIDRIGGPRRAAILGAGLLSVVVILLIARWAAAPTWVPVSSSIALEDMEEITQGLDEQGIPYRLSGGGTELDVAASDLARARVALAGEGMPQAGRPGLELFDQPAWGMTDFTQRVNYRRALEGELERTISNMSGVEAVKVHIAMEDAVGFRRDATPTEASIVLRLRGGQTPSRDMVDGITHLVAGSVDGVEADRVMVLDDRGELLSSPYASGSPAAVASRELAMRTEIENYLAAKASGLVSQIVGPGNVRVQVSADINLDRVERTVETVDPDRQVLSSEQRSEIIPGAEGGAGSSSVTTTYLNTRSVETYSGAVGNVERVTAAVLINDRMVVQEGVTTYEPRSPEELAEIKTLVSTAMGIDPSRGDIISVVSFPFDDGLEVEPPPAFPTLVRQFYRPAIALLALLLTFVIALRVTRTLKQPEAAKPEALASGDRGSGLNVLVDGDESVGELAAGEPELALAPAGPTTRDLVVAQIDENPEVAMKLMRAWMKED